MRSWTAAFVVAVSLLSLTACGDGGPAARPNAASSPSPRDSRSVPDESTSTGVNQFLRLAKPPPFFANPCVVTTGNAAPRDAPTDGRGACDCPSARRALRSGIASEVAHLIRPRRCDDDTDRSARANPAGRASAPAHLVTSPAEVVGRWRLTSFGGARPPAGTIRGLLVSRGQDGDQLDAAYDDGVNGLDVEWRMRPTGRLVVGLMTTTLVGCRRACDRPSGLGVAEARALRLDAEGDLVLLGRGHHAVATYAPRP